MDMILDGSFVSRPSSCVYSPVILMRSSMHLVTMTSAYFPLIGAADSTLQLADFGTADRTPNLASSTKFADQRWVASVNQS